MTLQSLARMIAKARHGTALGFTLQPWQIRYLRALDEYYATASAAGVSREDATKRLSDLMYKAQRSTRYRSEDALRDARRSLIAQPDGAQ